MFQDGFQCGVCRQWHDSLPLSFSVKEPLALSAVPDWQREHRVVFTPDQCIIDRRDFYLRGRIPIPILGCAEPFIWGVWARIGLRDFVRTNDLWRREGREAEPPFPGWLDTKIPLYGDTRNLEVRVQTQPVGRRPHFEIANLAHPLAREQKEGIPLHRVQEIAEALLHPEREGNFPEPALWALL